MQEIDKLSNEKRVEATELLKLLETRKKKYGILSSKLDRVPGQVQLFEDMQERLDKKMEDRARFYLYYGGNGSGKCHQYSDKILGYDSKWKLAGEIKVGDVLMGPDSKPRNVVATGGGYGKMYKIIPYKKNGEKLHEIIVNGEHQLMLIKNKSNEFVFNTIDRIGRNGDSIQISVNDLLKNEISEYWMYQGRHNADLYENCFRFHIEEDGEDNFYGFSLDGDHLYLDENFIVQHNTFVGCYITVLLALGYDTKKYNLPFIGVKKNIWIATKSGSNVKSTIMPYLLGDFSGTRIPEEMIEKITQDNGILKAVQLKNGCTIHIKTYDQGQENVQGGNPDFMWLDEEPVNQDVWGELKARTRTRLCEMLITMTPLNGLTGVYDFFFGNDNKELEAKCKIYRVSSLDNPHTDKTWTLGMSAEEYRLRVDGSFENPTGLVYASFSRSKNIIPYYDPTREEGYRFYRSIDFGTSHPTAIIFIAQDPDDNLYVYDEIRLANTELEEIVRQINQKSKGVEFEYFVRDSAAKREGLELEKRFGINTVPADKHSKGANDMSNRRTGILMINNLFHNEKLFIADSCKLLIKELESHYYKDGAKKDGEVIKENDDLLDAMRYIIYMVKNNYGARIKKSPILKKFDRLNKVENKLIFRQL